MADTMDAPTKILQDARRYIWMREEQAWRGGAIRILNAIGHSPSEFDAAIDAAMKREAVAEATAVKPRTARHPFVLTNERYGTRLEVTSTREGPYIALAQDSPEGGFSIAYWLNREQTKSLIAWLKSV